MTIWLLRLTWITLPFTAAPAIADAVTDWSDAPRVVAEVLLWSAWSVGVVAVLAPRPLSLTVIRTIAPLFVVVSAIAAPHATLGLAVLAILATVANAVLASSPPIALACAAGTAYGTELRHPLKVPPALLMGPLPLAVLLVGAGVAAGPLLLADESFIVGGIALPVGLVVAGLLARSLHTLSRRWAILVPAGLVIVDPMTLADPVLFTREDTKLLEIAPRVPPPEPEAVDLRLGAVLTSVAIEAHDPIPIARSLSNRHGARLVTTARVLFAPIRPHELLQHAAARRLPVVRTEAAVTP
ncbi:MAG: hypothetical protein ACXW1M_03915 [Acidimicrobiia bacterium]